MHSSSLRLATLHINAVIYIFSLYEKIPNLYVDSIQFIRKCNISPVLFSAPCRSAFPIIGKPL